MMYKVSDENGTRNATPDEAASIDAHRAAAAAQTAAADARAAARASALAKLSALGLTEEEIKAIVGGV